MLCNPPGLPRAVGGERPGADFQQTLCRPNLNLLHSWGHQQPLTRPGSSMSSRRCLAGDACSLAKLNVTAANLAHITRQDLGAGCSPCPLSDFGALLTTSNFIPKRIRGQEPVPPCNAHPFLWKPLQGKQLAGGSSSSSVPDFHHWCRQENCK